MRERSSLLGLLVDLTPSSLFIINVRSFNSWVLKVLCGAGAHNFPTAVLSVLFVVKLVSYTVVNSLIRQITE
ncbi:hypothetical protein AMELA_G00005660 [Ameiurus melas]|uniref:Uncharacterized protein n=1 Tax=Ameiurus melas TaxID=219545 RepID=A0A7J6BFX2_AMEME|nr:hypothetical protein AMELA_G00005660 [Ameiurus melas]